MAWLLPDTLTLEAGPHTISFKFQAQVHRGGGLDCFVFNSNLAWVPHGLSKPATPATGISSHLIAGSEKPLCVLSSCQQSFTLEGRKLNHRNIFAFSHYISSGLKLNTK
jgi:hypothetical protein